ncbi:MAG: TonB-dependent receptor [Bacteroidales bacterium]|nr:TonB-dependent receptor [Bacteroidales bacterium]
MKNLLNAAGKLLPCNKKLFLTMRFSLLLLICSILTANAASVYSQNARLSLKLDDATLSEVFDAFEEQSEFVFFYNRDYFNDSRLVSVNFEDKQIDEILNELFTGEPVTYEIYDRNILLKIPPSISPGSGKKYMQQEPAVSGVVTDVTGQPIPGATIVVKGTLQGTVTDAEGRYAFAEMPAGAVLVFSFVGMQTQEVHVGAQKRIDIVLSEDVIGIDAVIAIGYGTQKKATLTGSVAAVQGEDLARTPATTLSSTMIGRMPGVIVNTRSASPGEENLQINIRGKSSWQSGNNPLIIIDGIANRSGFERLNPNDIESISVLKDASAAIYGSRAANGVILVTTKRGRDGKPTLEYTGDFGLTQPTRVPEMARSWQFAQYYTEAQRSGFIYSAEEIEKFRQGADPNLYPNYNIEDYILQKVAPQSSHTFSIRGGNNIVKYYISSRYLYQDSYFKEGIDDYNSYNVRSNLDAVITENLKLSVNLSARRDDVTRAIGSNSVYNVNVGYTNIGFFEWMLGNRPTEPIFYANGLPAPIYNVNLVEMIRGKAGQKDDRTGTVNSQATARWDLPFITQGLFLEGTAAYDFVNVRTKEFAKSYDMYAWDNSTGEYVNLNVNPVMSRSLNDYFYNSYSTTLSAKLGYERSFSRHNINTFVAYEQYSILYEWINATRNTFLSDQIPYQFAGDANTQQNEGSGYEFAYRNIFGRFGYNYAEKYLIDFTLRRDESLKFPPEKRVGLFPGISIGWRLSEESFIKDRFTNVDFLKARASFGQMGSDNVGDYQYLSSASLQSTSDSYVFGSDPSVVSTLYFTGTPNPNITWEVANTWNIGLEGTLWNGLLGFEAEYFLSRRSNILATRNASVPTYAGMTLPDENIGKAQNQGVELMLSHRNSVSNLRYNLSGNIAFTSNKIIYMDESPNVPDYQKREGYPIDSWLLYQTDGIFNTQEEFDATPVKRPGARVGDIKYIDVNKDGAIDDNDKIRLYHSCIPKIIFGLNSDFEFRGFELSILFQGQAGAKTYVNPNERNGDINLPLWIYDNRWTPETAESATIPRPFYHRAESYNTLKSDFWLRDASFLRLKNLQLGYNLPVDLISVVGLKGARFYVSGSNLLLIDKIKHYDPEVVNDLGVYYPATRIYNFGVNLTF